MLKREDMMELTRRMTLSRSSFTRIAGCYLDKGGEIDGTFNRHFLRLSDADRRKNLELAKAIPYAETNNQLKEYCFADNGGRAGAMRRLLEAVRQCGLKNDALMETFYEQIAGCYRTARYLTKIRITRRKNCGIRYCGSKSRRNSYCVDGMQPKAQSGEILYGRGRHRTSRRRNGLR